MASATTALTLPCNYQGAKVLPPGIWILLPHAALSGQSPVASPCPCYLLWAKGKQEFINRKISSYGFKTHRHHQMWGENGTIYLVTSLRAVSNEQSTLKICFFLFAKKTAFYSLWLFLRSQCYQNMAHYVQGSLPDQCSLPTWPFPTQLLFSQKGKNPLNASSILFSIPPKAHYSGSCSFTWLKILKPTTTVTF